MFIMESARLQAEAEQEAMRELKQGGTSSNAKLLREQLKRDLREKGVYPGGNSIYNNQGHR